MLVGKIFAAPSPTAASVDPQAAQKIPGVHSVITGEDIRDHSDPYYGPAFRPPILAIDKVRFVGEPVAVVLAYDAHIAEAATHGFTRNEELPAVYDEWSVDVVGDRP